MSYQIKVTIADGKCHQLFCNAKNWISC